MEISDHFRSQIYDVYIKNLHALRLVSYIMCVVPVRRRSCISASVERVVTSFAYVEQMQQFFSSDFALALNLDGLNESHPILQEVASPDEINSLFDSISYSKVSNMGLYVGALVVKFVQLRRC